MLMFSSLVSSLRRSMRSDRSSTVVLYRSWRSSMVIFSVMYHGYWFVSWGVGEIREGGYTLSKVLIRHSYGRCGHSLENGD